MDPTGPADRPKRSGVTSILRALLLAPIPLSEYRLIDLVIMPVGIAIAVVVALPILAAALVAGTALGLALQAIGAPDGITALPGLLGFVGGLALGFVVLLRIYRRLPARIRSWVIPENEEPVAGASALPFRRDPDRDDATLRDRVAAADATLAAHDPPTTDR